MAKNDKKLQTGSDLQVSDAITDTCFCMFIIFSGSERLKETGSHSHTVSALESFYLLRNSERRTETGSHSHTF